MQPSSFKKVNQYYYDQRKPLGKGNFGTVYLAKDRAKPDAQYAVKVVPILTIVDDPKLKQLILREIMILRQIKGENIVSLIDVMQTTSNLYIFMDYCDGGTLSSLLEQEKNLDEEQACSIIKQIAKAFIDLAKLEIINPDGKKVSIMHRDIKPDNVMFHQGQIKVTDFGFAKAIEDVDKDIMNKHTSLGTPLYCPPQILQRKEYSVKCDVWSTGVVFYEILHGQRPWTAGSIAEMIKNIETKPLVFSKKIKPDIQDLITKMLKINESDRLTWQEVYDHPALKVAK